MTVKTALNKKVRWKTEGVRTVAECEGLFACIQTYCAPYTPTEHTCLVRYVAKPRVLLDVHAADMAEAKRACETAMRLEMLRRAVAENEKGSEG